MAEQATIIPIAGGKGGVGKSFVTANLAVALARRGHTTIAVDLDLGNSNLHSMLGLENRYPGVGEFLRGAVKLAPGELVVETTVPGLGFVPGDGRVPFMANITYNQKLVLLRMLKALPARYVLLDLSAGTSFNTLDLFLAGESGVLVTTPEHPAIMSALVFVKTLVLRALTQGLRGEAAASQQLNRLYQQSVKDKVLTIERFRGELAQTHPDAAEKIKKICAGIRPRLVYNMVENPEDTEIFARIERTLDEHLSVGCDHFGIIPYDPSVRQLLKRPGIFLLESPDSAIAVAIDRISNRVTRYWDTPIEGSAELLAERDRDVLPQGGSGAGTPRRQANKATLK
ncbi:MAG TPA: P-loop NTPase [Pyrinomonadaceae bacterium]|nr:P-loop NTPase [Pyrinomonadaceae bacterium]